MVIEELALDVCKNFGGSIKFCRGELPDDFGFSIENLVSYEEQAL